MYSTNNEGKSLIAERFIKTLKNKIYKELKSNDSKSYPGCMNKPVDQCNNTYHLSIGGKLIDADYTALT